MEFDIFMAVALVIAVAFGFAVYYLYNKYRCQAVDDVYDILRGIWDKYGERLEKDNPTLYSELKSAIDVMDKAMEDKEISIMEAFAIAQSVLPLAKRLVAYVKKQYGE